MNSFSRLLASLALGLAVGGCSLGGLLGGGGVKAPPTLLTLRVSRLSWRIGAIEDAPLPV